MTMLKQNDPAFAELRAALKEVASSRYAEEFLWGVDDTTVLTKSESGVRFAQLKANAQLEVLGSSVPWSDYEDRGLTDAQAGVIFTNVREGKPPERWLEGVCDEAALENRSAASFRAMVEDIKNSPNNHVFEEMDGNRLPWAELSAAAKLQYIARDAAISDVGFETFAPLVKETLVDFGEAALRVVLEEQKELHAIAKLFPDDGRTEPTPLVEQVKKILNYASALERQETERQQGREKLFEGINDILDGKPPQAWAESVKAFREILREDRPIREEVKSQDRGSREI
jgi:hypothetical protein